MAGNIPFIVEESKLSHSDENKASTILSHVEYAVFGLGNTQYDHYNATGKFMDRALAVVGAQRIIPLGLGDDNIDLEADFEAWKDQQFWPTLIKRYHVASSSNNGTATTIPKKTELPRCPYKVVYHEDNALVSSSNGTKTSASPNYDVPFEHIHSSRRHYFTAYECPITVVRELQTTSSIATNSGTNTNSKQQKLLDSTVHVEIDIGSARPLRRCTPDGTDITTPLSYSTADNLGVLPENSNKVIASVANALGYNLDSVISVESAPGGGDWHGLPFPIPISLRQCFLRYLDFTSPPRRSDLKRLSVFCTDSIDQKALLRMSSKEGRQEYKEKILDQYVGFVDLLRLCPSIQMPLEHLLHYCSPLQTRFFTISSSSSVYPNTVHLTVAVTKHERSDGSMFRGVCSTHLSDPTIKPPGQQQIPKVIRVFQRPSSFRLPSDVSKPIIMIGPGTGVAPMRALLQEREYQREQFNQSMGSNTLYFGCKHEAL
jgi:NADPH-ferrihemoprotein reductase